MRVESYRLHFSNISLFLNLGFFKAEQKLGQRFYIDLSFHLEPSAFKYRNEIKSVYDYSHVIKILNQLCEEKQFRLLENFASHIAKLFLLDNRILKLNISIRKPSVPINAILDHVELNMSFRNE